MDVVSTEKLATVLALTSLPDNRGGSCKVWREGKVRDDLVTFDSEGWHIIYRALGGDINLQPDAVLLNMKLALNQFLRSWKFEDDGPIHFDRNLAQRWVSLG
jgi:hypothetical protein